MHKKLQSDMFVFLMKYTTMPWGDGREEGCTQLIPNLCKVNFHVCYYVSTFTVHLHKEKFSF